MLSEFKEAFLLGFRREVWVIEKLADGESPMPEWNTLGSIVGVRDADSALAAARSNWSDVRFDGEGSLRAVAWAVATAEQREAATYEDDLRAREKGIRQHENDLVSLLRAMSAEIHRTKADDTADRMPGIPTKSERQVGDAIAAFRFLAGLGGLPLDEADIALLEREVPRDAIRWRGGIRDTPTGGVTFIEAIDCRLLNEVETSRSNVMLASAYRGFYEAAADGISLTDVSAVREWYGKSVEDNYPDAGPSFLQFATTYWTLKVLLRQLDFNGSTTLVRAHVIRMDELLGDLFFPLGGPILIDPARRELDQRRLLEAFAPRINVSDFLSKNPILMHDRRISNKKRWNW